MIRRLRNVGIRLRIALAIFAVSTGILILMSVAVYGVFDQQLTASLDNTLRLRAIANLRVVDTTGVTPALARTDDPGLELATGTAVLRLYGRDGALLSDPSDATTPSNEEQAAVRDSLATGRSVVRTVDLEDDEDYRIVVDPVTANGSITGALVTGLERSRVDQPLAILRLILVFADAITALALGLGSYWIARRVLQPVAALTQTAERIIRGDLHERVPAPANADELGRLASTFNTMLARLEETIERERRFTADASHELRTPLAAIETGLDVTLAHEREPAEYRRVLTMVHGQTRRLHALAEQLLLLSRLDADAMRGRFEPLQLGELVEEIVAAFASRHEGATVRLRNADERIDVLGDYELLGRAVINLLENAALHVGPSVAIDIEVSRDVDGSTRVTVTDDGPGITGALAADAFRRFRRGDPSRMGSGAGLGLSIVEAIMRAHGGLAVLEAPAHERGARFTLRLPPLADAD